VPHLPLDLCTPGPPVPLDPLYLWTPYTPGPPIPLHPLLKIILDPPLKTLLQVAPAELTLKGTVGHI
jgi:hypothetical protein